MPTISKPRKPLSAVVGATCAAILCVNVPNFEGTILRGYKDPIGIVTACSGHTKTAIMGKPYSPEECEVLLHDDLVEHATGVLGCVPSLEGRTYPLAAAISFTFNVGVARFCSSTMARLFRVGDIAGACAQLSRWTKAGGVELKGLVKRRIVERAICETGL